VPVFDSPSLLSQFNRYTGRPDTDDSITDTQKYERLTEAQQSVIADLMVRCPNALYPKVPYQLFPQPAPNSVTPGTGTVTLTGASFAAGASLTATASVAQFTIASIGRVYTITDPATNIPFSATVTAYTSTTIVTMVSDITIPLTSQSVAISGWVLVNVAYPDGQIFVFGENANGYPIMPMGKASVYPSLASFPDFAWLEGLDYVNEGTQIRLPNNRTWSGPLYWYGVPQPNDITASAQPAIFPEGARELIVWRACANFANEGNTNDKLSALMEGRYNQAFGRWALAYKTQWSAGSGVGSISGLRMTIGGVGTNGLNLSAL
jgi:hypothetical protein